MNRRLAFCLALWLCLFSLQAAAYEPSAAGCVVMDAATGEVLYGKEEHDRLAMASTTKIMTAYLLCLDNDLDGVVPITESMVGIEGTSMYLKAGDTPTKRDLLYGLLLASGNDAAQAVALALCGSTEAFVQRMNDTAGQLGLTDTHFNTPSGLDGASHYTSAYDLAKLTVTALQLPDFARACATESVTLTYGEKVQTFSNHNRLVRTDGRFIGVKTGYTSKAGRCLVSAAAENGHTVICVTLDDPNDWADHEALVTEGLETLNKRRCTVEQQSFCLPVVSGSEQFAQALVPELVLTGVSDVTVRYDLPAFLYAPVQAGDWVGKAVYSCGEQVVATQPIVAQRVVNLVSQTSRFWRYKRNLAALLAAL